MFKTLHRPFISHGSSPGGRMEIEDAATSCNVVSCTIVQVQDKVVCNVLVQVNGHHITTQEVYLRL